MAGQFMMGQVRALAIFALLLLLASPRVQAQAAPKPGAVKTAAKAPAPKMDLPDSLVKQAKVTEAAARKTALAQVPEGRVTAGALVRDDGRLTYSYHIRVTGHPGVTRVHVDALTGASIVTEPEDQDADSSSVSSEEC